MVHAVTADHFSSVFASFDRDADGKISAAELWLCMKAALGEDVSVEDAEALVALADTDGDRSLEAGVPPLVAPETRRRRSVQGAEGGVRDVRGEGRRVHHAVEPDADAR
ncbi:hypothetical protein ZWY2020_039108 [Hordeum vulgare]|nr:hypothetical protein ZWY2020_039108 [Hordeum vulgare]